MRKHFPLLPWHDDDETRRKMMSRQTLERKIMLKTSLLTDKQKDLFYDLMEKIKNESVYEIKLIHAQMLK